MTQKEAVKAILDFLPQEAFFDGSKKNFQNVLNIYHGIKIFYSDLYCKANGQCYHFSQVDCQGDTFPVTACLCVVVNNQKRIKSFTQHLPYSKESACR
jgi:hypothetical protein